MDTRGYSEKQYPFFLGVGEPQGLTLCPNVHFLSVDERWGVNFLQNFSYIRVAFGDVHHSVCTERESGWNPEQCPLLCACLMQILSEPLLREGVSVGRVRKPAR